MRFPKLTRKYGPGKTDSRARTTGQSRLHPILVHMLLVLIKDVLSRTLLPNHSILQPNDSVALFVNFMQLVENHDEDFGLLLNNVKRLPVNAFGKRDASGTKHASSTKKNICGDTRRHHSTLNLPRVPVE